MGSTAHTPSRQTFCACAKQTACEHTTNWPCPKHIPLTHVRRLPADHPCCMSVTRQTHSLGTPIAHVVMQRSGRFQACVWPLRSLYFLSIYVFDMYDSYTGNALVYDTWKCHGRKHRLCAEIRIQDDAALGT